MLEHIDLRSWQYGTSTGRSVQKWRRAISAARGNKFSCKLLLLLLLFCSFFFIRHTDQTCLFGRLSRTKETWLMTMPFPWKPSLWQNIDQVRSYYSVRIYLRVTLASTNPSSWCNEIASTDKENAQEVPENFGKITIIDFKNNEYMKFIYLHCGYRNVFVHDPRSKEHYLSNSENQIQACTGFEPLTSAILVQRSTNWAKKPTGVT